MTKYQLFRNKIEAQFREPVYKAIQAQIRPVVEAYRRGGKIEAQKAAMVILNDALVPVLMDIYVQSGVYAADKQSRALARERKGFIDWYEDIRDFFTRYILNRSVLPITRTTRELLLQSLSDSELLGWTFQETLTALRMQERTLLRAEMIVRTEVTAGFGYGQILGAEDFPYEVIKRWDAINDRRTRRTHKHGTGVDGEIREWGIRFSNGLQFPGDKAGPASEVINCRCRLVILPKKQNGQLIPRLVSLFKSEIKENETL